MTRVVGTDPGTSRLDLLLLVDGEVADQVCLAPECCGTGEVLVAAASLGTDRLAAGPSGYGLPLVRAGR
ncbi:MAG: hypothetical protein WKF75_01075 [Singulisphaera sp.]